MEIETQKLKEGVEITVRSDEKVALSVWDGDLEEIYLPEMSGDNSTYYVEKESREWENGFQVLHRGEVDEIEVISS
ncbi:hypothetical protein [Candidatus Nanohalococcus occultus]|uniref:hypothetical protein n=1 Tax=Candidatus Nanohalococcus occultus TaxID=2978047 RepID=UPI00325FC926